MKKKMKNFHYFREVGNTVAPVSIMFSFHLYNNTVRQAEEAKRSTKRSDFKYKTLIKTNNGDNQQWGYGHDYCTTSCIISREESNRHIVVS